MTEIKRHIDERWTNNALRDLVDCFEHHAYHDMRIEYYDEYLSEPINEALHAKPYLQFRKSSSV